jgi:hypothetical protein
MSSSSNRDYNNSNEEFFEKILSVDPTITREELAETGFVPHKLPHFSDRGQVKEVGLKQYLVYSEEEESEEDMKENPTKVFKVLIARGPWKCTCSIGQETWCKHIAAVSQFRTGDVGNREG